MSGWKKTMTDKKKINIRGMLSVTILLCMFALCIPQTADAGQRWKLSVSSKTMRAGQTVTLRVKNVSGKAKVKWKSSKKSIVKIVKTGKKSVKIKAVKSGKAYITVKYKGKTKKCRIKVKPKQKKKSKTSVESPVMNEQSVTLYHIGEKYQSYVPRVSSHLYEFQFKVTGTKQEVDHWRLTGEGKRYMIISEDGVVKGIWEPAQSENGISATVTATLDDGQKITAQVKLYEETDTYIDGLFSRFEAEHIRETMTEREKAEKAAWYIGAVTDYARNQADWKLLLLTGSGDCYASRMLLAEMCQHMGIRAEACQNYTYHGQTLVRADGTYYLITTGYDEPKPRSYMISAITDEKQRKKIMDDNAMTPALFGE